MNPLIFGAYGETNTAFNKLLSAAAEVGSIRHQAALGVNSPEKAKAVLLWQLRRKLAAAIVRANLNCLQFLMGHLGISRNNSWETSVRRRQQARSRFFNSSDPSVVTDQFRNAYSTYSDRTRDGIFYSSDSWQDLLLISVISVFCSAFRSHIFDHLSIEISFTSRSFKRII